MREGVLLAVKGFAPLQQSSLLRLVAVLVFTAYTALLAAILIPAAAAAAAASTAAEAAPKDDDSDDDMPPLQPLDPAKAAADEKKKEEEESKKAAMSKSDVERAGKDADDSDGDMPPLTDQAGDKPAGGAEAPKPRAVTFGHGATKSKLFDFEPWEKDGVEGAYKHLGLDPSLSDAALQSEATKLMSSERSAERGHKDTSSRLGALLTILCSRTSLHTIPQAPSTTHSLARALRLLYLSEAQLHLTDVRLPLPADAVVPSDVDLRTESSAYEHLPDERTAHDRTRERLRAAQIALEKSTSAATAAKSKAERCEGEAKSLRGEVSRLKSEGDLLKAQAKEGYAAKDAVEREVDRLKEEVERYRREAQAPPPGSDKKDFVVQRLSKQVVELTRQLKAKNDENLKLMLELATVGGREG
ncbi:hypothetical protein JCM10450v2_007294 [Rhodotorula kratochvilovae]